MNTSFKRRYNRLHWLYEQYKELATFREVENERLERENDELRSTLARIRAGLQGD